MQKIPVSVTMMMKNGEHYLSQCLSALQDFAEIVILDNGSTDNSMEIAKGFPNVKLYQGEFVGFGAMKNDVASRATNDWILNIDCDEILTSELVEEIRQLDFNQFNTAYAINRINHYRGRPIKTCGWYPDFVKRLYNRTTVRFNDRRVHEDLEISSSVQLQRLKHSFKHFSFDGAEGMINKMNKYTTCYAEQHCGKKSSSVVVAILHGLSAFLKSYILRRGFLDGGDGFVISVGNAIGSYYKYIKLREANLKLKDK